MAKWILTGYIDFLFIVTDSNDIRDELLDQPFKISDAKLKVIAQYLSDNTVLKNREEGD